MFNRQRYIINLDPRREDSKPSSHDVPQNLRRSLGVLRLGLFHLRSFSHKAGVAIAPPQTAKFDLSTPLEYLEGLPRPDPKHAETITAMPRSKSGKNIADKERKVGRVPSIVFEQENGQQGGNKRLISVQTKQMLKLVDHLAAFSSSPGSLSSRCAPNSGTPGRS